MENCDICGQDIISEGTCCDCSEKATYIGMALLKKEKAPNVKNHSWIGKANGIKIVRSDGSTTDLTDYDDDTEIQVRYLDGDNEQTCSNQITIKELCGLLVEPENYCDAFSRKKIQDLETDNWNRGTKNAKLRVKMQRIEECLNTMERTVTEMNQFKMDNPDVFDTEQNK